MRMYAAWLALSILGAIAAPAQAGSWKYQLDQREQNTLTYSEEGKVMFFLGCGRAFGLHAKYPGKASKDGKAVITIASGNRSMTFKGDFEEPSEDDATTFVQYDLGYRRQDLALNGKRWKALRDRMLNLLDSGKPVEISAGVNNYVLPPIEAKGWREALGKCG